MPFIAVTPPGSSNGSVIIIPNATPLIDGIMTKEQASKLSNLGMMITDEFVATSGQVAFVLSKVPISNVAMFVNGQLQRLNVDFVVSYETVYWLNNQFQIDAGDVIECLYTSS